MSEVKPISVDLGKRLEYINGNITFKCPICSYKMVMLDDTADLEYGSFHGPDSCWNCEAQFEEYDFKVKATVTISVEKG